ncbi:MULTISPECIES: lipid A deacylase LpxR family protein [Niastella]|uniref:Lipid A deacylase LpxR family protein n=1 Tax=Niastella soli TaxID=2821487 RepID=A0ABS3YS03_9BACT|nr:lipid A deacylase LpxR family protein [Niastella soli]MBO9200674.1 lipid A deacylase LpxR family protein [Niastella soli]
MERGQFIILLWVAMVTGTAYGQQQNTYRHLFRAYEDNDLFNVVGGVTDRGYTNGTRADFFYINNKPARFFLHRIMPKAGDSSVNTYGFSIMQVMITPKNILKRIPDKNDFPYSGALFATHSLHATNAIKRYSWQSELLLGAMGPPSLARQTQVSMHRLVGYIKPNGWDYQLKTDLLLNISVAGEKELAHVNKALELIGGAQVFTGTALNGLSAWGTLRFGKMEPYFNGYMSRFSTPKGRGSRQQLYFTIRPSAEYTLSNALIGGGIFNRRNRVIPKTDDPNNDEPEMVRERVVARCDYGVVASSGRVGLSYTLTYMTPAVKGTGVQETSNISFFLAW